MRNPLLNRSSPQDLARYGQVIEKQMTIADFPRLTELLAAGDAALPGTRSTAEWRRNPVAIRLAFGWSDGHLDVPAACGRVATRVPAVCQRCLAPFELPLEADLKLLLVTPEQGITSLDEPTVLAHGEGRDDGYDEAYEVWELDEETFRPLDILEEALIMAMPLAPMHGREEGCEPPAGEDSIESGHSDAGNGEMLRPFAGLRSQMKGQRHKND